jgi:urease accessory protein
MIVVPATSDAGSATAPTSAGRVAASVENPAAPAQMLRLVRLLQLASPALPIGGYSYSQGLESAVEQGVVRDAASAQRWIGDLLAHVVTCGDAAVLWRLTLAAGSDWPAFAQWNAWFRATRETAELRAETEQMGGSLVKLLADLDLFDAAAREAATRAAPVTLPAAFALAARGFALGGESALAAYVWSWLENQVLAAIKLLPLGQVAGQKLLVALGARIPAAIAAATALTAADVASFAPGLALASARHETQYSRIFRS